MLRRKFVTTWTKNELHRRMAKWKLMLFVARALMLSDAEFACIIIFHKGAITTKRKIEQIRVRCDVKRRTEFHENEN